jgi:DNA polymerase
LQKYEELYKLRKEVENCKRCNLYKTRTNVVFGEGDINSKIMFVGESPGFWEDKKGKPFVGPSGKFLNQLLYSINLNRKDIFITSVLKCRPVAGKRNRPPKQGEIKTCKAFLKKQIGIINPKVIVLLGNVALHALMDKKLNISKVHGKIIKRNKTILFTTFHPAAERLRKLWKKI